MTLEPRTRVGPYEILSQLGAGGMGEVYRARDERLGRDVAVKILPGSYSESDDRLSRFEQEARAAGILNHPNVVAVYDVGHHDGSPFVVTELLEGATLRERLRSGPVAARRALDYAIQIVRGLAAAHEKGIIHRDVKPENIFITNDGRVKILDFGLAKVTTELPLGVDSAIATLRTPTNPGVVMGTVGYMSPEQVRGLPADHRTDVFSFGAVMYEMLTGSRAFGGDSAIEVMNSILKEDPPEISSRTGSVPIGLDRIVRHCLEKDPVARFQSASDLAFDLEAQSLYSGPLTALGPSRARELARRAAPLLAAVLVGALLTIAGLYASRSLIAGNANTTPTYEQLTYRRGAVHSARFAPDGTTILYSGSWEGTPTDIFIVRPGNPETRSLGMPDSSVVAVSKTGEMAVIHGDTLSRVAYTGGAPRAVLEHVLGADWSPTREDLAVIHYADGKYRLEYPIGTVVHESDTMLSTPRFSPDARHIAFFSHPIAGDDRGVVMVADIGGPVRPLGPSWSSLGGLAWSPTGDEVWFAGASSGANRSLEAVDLSGGTRLISNVAGSLYLHDVTADGRMLVAREALRIEIVGHSAGDDSADRDLSWLDGSLASDISSDGKTLLFSEVNHGGGTNYGVYLRKMDGSPAVRLGEGNSTGLSPDGKWALAITPTAPQKVVVLPTGPGEMRVLIDGGFEQIFNARWTPDGARVMVVANMPGRGPRVFIVDAAGGPLTPVTPENVRGTLVTPDGQYVAGVDVPTMQWSLYSLTGGAPIPVAGIGREELPIRWAADGKSILLRTGSEFPVKIVRLIIATGRRETVAELEPKDATGIKPYPRSVVVTPDGSSYAFTYLRGESELYLLEGCSGWCRPKFGIL